MRRLRAFLAELVRAFFPGPPQPAPESRPEPIRCPWCEAVLFDVTPQGYIAHRARCEDAPIAERLPITEAEARDILVRLALRRPLGRA